MARHPDQAEDRPGGAYPLQYASPGRVWRNMNTNVIHVLIHVAEAKLAV